MEAADILVVDDDPKVIKAITRALKNRPYKAVGVHNGPEALDRLAQTPFKVIISDIKMNGMHGFELLDKVQAMHPQTTRIVLSGHADVELILKLVNQRGIDRYLTKPWENEDLILAIEKCMELYDLRGKK